MKTLYLFLVCLSLLLPIYCGKVKPYGAQSIVLSSTNAGDIADYNFTMSLDTDLPSTGVIEISFPNDQYIAGLGLPYTIQVYAPYPTLVSATLDTVTAHTVICSVGARTANESFTIGIKSVRNPLKIGGAGNFKIATKVGTKTLDVNGNFGLIGIYPASTTLVSASIDFQPGASQLAGELTSYVITLVPSVNLPALMDIKVIFPTIYNFSSVIPSQCSDYSGNLAMDITCNTNPDLLNVIIFGGFNKTIAQGSTIQLGLANIYNPSRKMTTESLSIWVDEVGTNNTIQKFEAVPGLTIDSGQIYDVSLTNLYSGFPLYTNLDRQLVLRFRPANPFNVIQIATAFPIVKSCSVINGLSLRNRFDPIICSPSSHVMVIKGFQTYNPQDIYLRVVEIQFLATMPSSNVLTNQVEIYTFLDEDFTQQVDENTNTDASQLQILAITAPGAQAGTTLTTGSALLGTANSLAFTFSTSGSYYSVPYVTVELDKGFKGAPACYFAPLTAGASAFVSKTCTFKNGILKIFVNADMLPITATYTTPPKIYVTGLYNPSVPKSYTVRYYIFSSAYALLESDAIVFSTIATSISTISMVPLADAASHVTTYVLSFTNPTLLQDGYSLLSEPSKLSSHIDIRFMMLSGSGLTFTYDLGSGIANYGDYPCELIGIVASDFTTAPRCTLIQGPSSSPSSTDAVTIRVLDFNPILAGKTLTINIPVTNSITSTSAPIVNVRTYVIQNYVEYLLAEQSLSVAATTSTLGSSMTAGTITMSNSSVQATSSLYFEFTTSTAVTAGSNSSIQVEYPSGYTFTSGQVIVTLDGTTVAANKLHFASAFNFFTIELSTNLATGLHKVNIANVGTPSASLSTGNTLTIRTTSAHKFVQVATFTLPTVQPGAFITGSVTSSITPNTYSHPYASYQFNFQTTAYSSSGSTIKITFPTGYSLDSHAECTKTIGLTDLSSSSPVQCTFTTTTVTVSNFQGLNPGQTIQLQIFGITNPSASVAGLNYVISILDPSSNVIETKSLAASASTLTGPAYTSQDLKVTVVRLTPSNPLIDASFLMTLNPGYQLPKGAEMTIIFDTNFGVLFTETINDIECLAEGGLHTLTECTVNGLQLTTQFGETSNSSIPVDFYYFGLVRYPTANTQLSGFSVTVTYKGATIATATTFPTVYSSGAFTPLTNIVMDYYPRNEGEQANYIFTFDLNTTTLNSSMYFLIRFPMEYDPKLFLYDPVVESDQLIGALKIIVRSREVRIYGFQDMTVTGYISIRLWGVVNPNKVDITKTGSYAFALMYGDVAIEANNNEISGIVPLLAPDRIQFISLNVTSGYSRYLSDYYFTFLTTKDILPSDLGGQLFIDYPPNYLIDSYGGECNLNEDFSFIVNCDLDYNRIFVNASNPRWSETMGSLTLEVDNIRTPDLAGDTLNFVVSNYDSANKKILSRTYANLNPASLHFAYDGLLISVNNDLAVDVEVGTYTDEIVIQMPSASLQTLTFTPNTLDPNIIVTPFPLQIKLGDTEVRFRVAAPRTQLLKLYYITWSKTGDALTPTYANLPRTTLNMVKNKYTRQMNQEIMEYIPSGGVTFPLFIYTNNPPYSGLIVNLTILNSDTLAHLNTSYLIFSGGDFNHSYHITVDDSHALTSVQVHCSITGIDGGSYALPNATITIPITAHEYTQPQILSSSVVDWSRTTASFNITVSTLSFVYYVVANRFMPVPTFINVQNQTENATLSHSNPIYGVAYVKQTPKNITFSVSGLEPNLDYDVYIYVMNLNQLNNDTYTKLQFSTNPPQRIAEFIMQVKQDSIASDMKNEIISRIAGMLSIDKSRVVQRTSNCTQTRDSLSYNTANTTYLHLYVLPDPTSENDNNAPINLVRNLNTRTTEIKAFISRLADGDLLQMQEVPYNIPGFAVRPVYTSSTYTTITTTVVLSACGYIHAIAIPVASSQSLTASGATKYASENSSVQFASSYQIYSGLDLENQPAISTSLRVDNYANDYALTIGGLTDHLIYKVYFTTENDWPAYNRLLPSPQVARVEAKTIKKRKPLNVYSINFKEYQISKTGKGSPLTSQISWASLFIVLLVNLFI